MPTGIEETTEQATVPAHFCKVEQWAEANGIGINSVYEFLRRKSDPMPHLRIGTKRLVDDELALHWLRRNYGVGVPS